MSTMTSSDAARRTSDESESSQRRSQTSLPSIQELTESLNATAQPPTTSSQQRPPPYSAAPPRPFADGPPDARPYPRPEPVPTFGNSAPPPPPPSTRAAIPPPSHAAYGGPHPPTPTYMGREKEVDLRQSVEMAPRHISENYPRYSQPHISAGQASTATYPPGQLPLPPISSPRQSNPALVSFSETSRPPIHRDEDYAPQYSEAARSRPEYIDVVKRVGLSSRVIFNFAEAFNAAALEPNSRLPTEAELNAMMDNAAVIQQCVDHIKGMIQQNKVYDERARDIVRDPAGRRPLEEEDHRGYGTLHHVQQQQHPHHHQHHPPHQLHPLHHQNAYPLSEAKKRRGVSLEPPAPSAAPRVTDPPRKRAAPPGRCHSCNRVDTPEWRRGPDGARTLCNACGLHYAKLERKRQSESRSLRPKPVHDP
ncbi:hypothetical protein GE09DRAFT_524879 [Coniochaeta sp. 2T2.1]|nr:hypothetical protein GE09DRAFT_524879 [Coniochaeta sp. 2T2.1]